MVNKLQFELVEIRTGPQSGERLEDGPFSMLFTIYEPGKSQHIWKQKTQNIIQRVLPPFVFNERIEVVNFSGEWDYDIQPGWKMEMDLCKEVGSISILDKATISFDDIVINRPTEMIVALEDGVGEVVLNVHLRNITLPSKNSMTLKEYAGNAMKDNDVSMTISSMNTIYRASAVSLHKEVVDLEETLVQIRRSLHKLPELSWNEFATQKQIMETLQNASLQPKEFGKTGVVCDIGSTEPLFTLAIRAEMDGVSIDEDNHRLSYQSRVDGISHACGHDGHIAITLGCAILLSKMTEKLSKNQQRVRLIFEPAQTIGQGAKKIIKESILDGVNEIYSMKSDQSFEIGKVKVKSGLYLPRSVSFTIEINGISKHCGHSEGSIDAIHIGVQLISALQSIPKYATPNHFPSSITITNFVSQSKGKHIISSKATISANLITFSMDDSLEKRIRDITDSLVTAFGATSKIEFEEETKLSAAINHPGCVESVTATAKKVLGEDSVMEEHASNVPDDLSFLLEKKPGCVFFMGSKEHGKKWSPLYSGTYNFNDNAIIHGLKFWIRLIEKRTDLSLFDDQDGANASCDSLACINLFLCS